MDAIVDSISSILTAVATPIFWLASRIFGLADRDTVPGWAKFLAAVLIFSLAMILAMILWAYIVIIIGIVVIGAVIVGFLAG